MEPIVAKAGQVIWVQYHDYALVRRLGRIRTVIVHPGDEPVYCAERNIIERVSIADTDVAIEMEARGLRTVDDAVVDLRLAFSVRPDLRHDQTSPEQTFQGCVDAYRGTAAGLTQNWIRDRLSPISARLARRTFADLATANQNAGSVANEIESEIQSILGRYNFAVVVGSCLVECKYPSPELLEASNLAHRAIIAFLDKRGQSAADLERVRQRWKDDLARLERDLKSEREKLARDHEAKMKQLEHEHNKKKKELEDAAAILDDELNEMREKRRRKQRDFQQEQQRDDVQAQIEHEEALGRLEIDRSRRKVARATETASVDGEFTDIEKARRDREAATKLDAMASEQNVRAREVDYALEHIESLRRLPQSAQDLPFEPSQLADLSQQRIAVSLKVEADRMREIDQAREHRAAAFHHEQEILSTLWPRLVDLQALLVRDQTERTNRRETIELLGTQLSNVLKQATGVVKDLKIVGTSSEPLARFWGAAESLLEYAALRGTDGFALFPTAKVHRPDVSSPEPGSTPQSPVANDRVGRQEPTPRTAAETGDYPKQSSDRAE